jgi:UDPglucose--hexose-1-phosphate uridylyltransferase
MSELRKDYFLPRWVIINTQRGKRPHQFQKAVMQDVSFCFFCPGNENTTPPETYRTGTSKKWRIRVFPNKFAVVDDKGKIKKKTRGLLTHDYAYGVHEVLVETPNHKKQLWDLSMSQIEDVLRVYHLRINEISKQKNIKYVLVFKNHGKEGGTSIVHTHTQIIGLHEVPTSVKEKIKYNKSCQYCKIIKKESKSKRLAFQNKTMIGFTPYASRYNYEVWLMPKKHVMTFDDFNDQQFKDMADLLKRALVKIRKLGISYNFYIHYAPNKSNLHFHIEITPRKATWAGFELGSGIIINSIEPEHAAEYYRS